MMWGGSPCCKKAFFSALALFLVIAFVVAPMASAAKDSEGSKEDHGNKEKDDKQDKNKKNGGDNNVEENVFPIDNNFGQDIPESDNNVVDLVDNLNQSDNTPEQLENVVLSEPVSQGDNVQDQPQTVDNSDQLSGSGEDQPEEEQPVSQPEEEQPVSSTDYETQNSPNVEPESEMDIHDLQPLENQFDFESSSDATDVSVHEINSDPIDQTNDLPAFESDGGSQQAILETASQTGTVGFAVWFSELSVFGLGLGTVLFVSLAHAKIQQKYMLQLLSLKALLSIYFISVKKALERTYLAHLHFGKIKCRAGFTKEEALAFFRECQRLPISFSRQY